jgi:hypothetical protein
MPPPAAAKASSSPPGIGFNLGAIMVALMLLGVGLAYGIDAIGRAARAPAPAVADEMTIARTLGARDLDIPASWFRYDEQRVEGFAKQIDLRFALPLGPDGARRDIEVTLLPRSGARPSARLLDGVYLHMFAENELSGPPGLVGKPLSGSEGYRGEIVWYDPISADPFVAKCSEPLSAETASRCLRTVYLAPGVAAAYVFDADVLANWREFDPAVGALLRRIGVAP